MNRGALGLEGLAVDFAHPPFEDVVSRLQHATVPMAAKFVEECGGVAHEFHHALKIGIFFISAEKFEFAVADKEHQWRAVFSHPVEGSKLVDSGL